VNIRFTSRGVRVRGFTGRASDGQAYIATPEKQRWHVRGCDEYRAFDKVEILTPEELDVFAEERSVTWADFGNGIVLYSKDMDDFIREEAMLDSVPRGAESMTPAGKHIARDANGSALK
jgi:hypothetical protein